MKLKLDLNTTTTIPRYCMEILGSWPIPKDAERRTYVKQQIWWWATFLITLYGETWLVNYCIYNWSDVGNLVKGLPETSLGMSQIGKQIICKIYNDSLWEVVAEYGRFLATASPEELEFLHSELQFVYVVHAIYIFGCIADPIIFTATPFIDGRELPAHAKYPWSLDAPFAYESGYLSHALSAVTLSCMVNMDVIFATMLWCVVIRYRFLARKMLKAESAMDIQSCAKEQENLIRHARQIADITRWMALVSVVQIFIMVTAGGVLLLSQPAFYELVIYSMMMFDGVAELMLYSWPADNICAASKELAYAGFQCVWYGKPKEMAMNLRIVMLRCDNPVTISSPGLLPVISREFFGSIMMTTFSYITTLRAVASQ